MNIKKMIVFLFVFLWTPLIFLPSAFAVLVWPSSYNQATIHWDTLKYTGLSTPYESESWSRAYSTKGWGIPVPPVYVQERKSGIVDTEAQSLTTDSWGFGTASALTLPTSITATANASATSSDWNHEYTAQARAQRSLGFATGQGGGVTFSIDYSLSQTLVPLSGKVSGYVRAWSWLRLWDDSTKSWNLIDSTFTYADNTVGGGFSGGNLSFTYNAQANSHILFETGADARAMASPVPVPPAILLLGFGIAGLIAVKRRKIG